MFMNFQPKPMTRAMKESHSSPLANLGRETAAREKLLDRFVNLHSINASLDFLQRQCLPSFHSFPKFSLRVARAPAHDCACQIAKISGLRVTWKDIQNNQRIRVQRSEAALMWIAGLIAACHNCA